MTAKERNLWLGVGILIVGTLMYQYFSRGFAGGSTQGDATQAARFDLQTAERLLTSRDNLEAKQRAVRSRLNQLKQRFFATSDPEQAGVELLKVVEKLTVSSGLEVQAKSTSKLSGQLIGVTLEGKTTPVSLTRFLYEVKTGTDGLKVKRLQTHSLPDKSLLNYQVVVVSLLVN
jgi:hypothetical protein